MRSDLLKLFQYTLLFIEHNEDVKDSKSMLQRKKKEINLI